MSERTPASREHGDSAPRRRISHRGAACLRARAAL